jgi:predicted ester cyclase
VHDDSSTGALVTEANKVLLQEFFERVYNQGDIDFLDELTSPDFVSHDRGNPTHDREGVKAIVGAIKGAFPDVVFTADDVFGEGDRAAARFTMRGTHAGEFMGVPPTNTPIVVTGIDIVRFERGKAVEHWHEWSGMELLQQLGVLGSQ